MLTDHLCNSTVANICNLLSIKGICIPVQNINLSLKSSSQLLQLYIQYVTSNYNSLEKANYSYSSSNSNIFYLCVNACNQILVQTLYMIQYACILIFLMPPSGNYSANVCMVTYIPSAFTHQSVRWHQLGLCFAQDCEISVNLW